MKRRQLRLGELLRDVIARAVQFELRDPRLKGLISITKVVPNPDYSEAKVSYSVLGSESDKASTHGALNRSASALKAIIQRECELRVVPHLRFVFDDSLQKEQHFHALLKRALDSGRKESGTEEE